MHATYTNKDQHIFLEHSRTIVQFIHGFMTSLLNYTFSPLILAMCGDSL